MCGGGCTKSFHCRKERRRAWKGPKEELLKFESSAIKEYTSLRSTSGMLEVGRQVDDGEASRPEGAF